MHRPIPKNWYWSILIWLYWSATASACTCLPKLPARDALVHADVVFVGRAIACHVIEVDLMRGSARWGYSFDFEVQRVYKGRLSSEVTIRTFSARGGCGFPFVLGEDYLVYAQGDEQFVTTICDRTAGFRHAESDLEELGPPITVFDNVDKHSSLRPIMIALLAFLSGLVVGRESFRGWKLPGS